MVRRALQGVALASVGLLIVLGASALPATADDVAPPPIPTPSGGSTSGPTYVITPGVGGSELPAPSDPKDVELAKQADQAKRAAQHHARAGAGKHSTTRSTPAARPGRPPSTATVTAGRQTPLVTTTAVGETAAPAVRAFAALVAMVVLFEITAVRRSVFRRRRTRVTAG